mmetsp:Transcript_19591/g.33402  ORF Transcript_19591/g.33402 Transcript_19591/m.33402 type:complete len:473 (+) Transcript_19591:61-1479(+)
MDAEQKNMLSDGAAAGASVHSSANNKVASTVWNGYDCVFSNDDYLKKLQNGDIHHGQNTEAEVSTDNPRMSFRRRGSGRALDDYGWLRQLDLRSDVPSIEEIRDWSFDTLQFEENILVEVFISMLEFYDLLTEFVLDRETLKRYVFAVMHKHRKDCYYQRTDIEGEVSVTGTTANASEEDCKSSDDGHHVLCEYHNWYHAVSCAQVCFLFLTLGGADQFLESKDIFCIIVGALIHDLDHPGTNNDFEVKRNTALAQKYHNDSVLERHSISEGLNLCARNPELDWLKSFDNVEDRKYVENYITEAILATDPARHATIVKEALTFVEEGTKAYGSVTSESLSESVELTQFDRANLKHRLFIGRLFLHSADISNPLHSSFDVARDWAVRVTTEFSKQASKEKELRLEVTSYMDGLDSEYNIAKVQISFFAFMVQPLFDAVGKLFPNLSHLNDWGESNCDGYREVIAACEKERGEG